MSSSARASPCRTWPRSCAISKRKSGTPAAMWARSSYPISSNWTASRKTLVSAGFAWPRCLLRQPSLHRRQPFRLPNKTAAGDTLWTNYALSKTNCAMGRSDHNLSPLTLTLNRYADRSLHSQPTPICL